MRNRVKRSRGTGFQPVQDHPHGLQTRATGNRPLVSFVIPTHNRRDVLLNTLRRVRQCGLSTDAFEVIVIDNASTDGTAEAVTRLFPSVTLLRQSENLGPCAKNVGLARARAHFIVFVDDDSFPVPGSVERMLRHFEADPSLGAAVFTVTLPDGARECSAYPNVCIGCGTGFRTEALREVGGLPDDFFMAAEEYDLSLRLLDAGWDVRAFDDLHVTHLKTPASRFPARITRLDVRNNLILAMRYFPQEWRLKYALDWLARYRMIASIKGHDLAFWVGAVSGSFRALAAAQRPLYCETFETFAKIDETERRLRSAARRLRLREVLFIDLGKNMLAYHRAAQRCGLRVIAIADAQLGGRGFKYRGIPIVTDNHARALRFDAAIVSNLSAAHAAVRRRQWRKIDSRPVVDLFESSSSFGELGERAEGDVGGFQRLPHARVA